METLECRFCWQTLLIDRFYKDSRYTSGYSPRCKACNSKAVRKSQKKNWKERRTVTRVQAKRRYLKHREKILAYHAEWRAKNHDKTQCHNAINNAIRAGKLVRLPCQRCGINRKTHAHHYKGYEWENRFKIEWLCDHCHRMAHMTTQVSSSSS